MMKTCLVCALTVGAVNVAAAQPPHTWKLDRPVVSGYWPAKGDPNTKVVIRGQNFSPDTAVMLGSAMITSAHVTANEISFAVPKDAKNGTIVLHHPGLADLAVGGFEIAHYDGADAKRADAERQHAAEALWKDRAKTIAKDRAARDAALVKQEHDLEASREQRRVQEVTDVRTKWQQPALVDPDVQAELTLHAQRVADLERMDRLAAARNDGKLVVRVQVVIAKENERHQQRMTTIQAAFKK